jgi:hypothetical protein
MSLTMSSGECIHVGVPPPLTMFGCKIMLLETLDPAGHLSFQVLETKEPGQGRVVSTQVEFSSVELFVDVVQHVHSGSNSHQVTQ